MGGSFYGKKISENVATLIVCTISYCRAILRLEHVIQKLGCTLLPHTLKNIWDGYLKLLGKVWCVDIVGRGTCEYPLR